MSCVEFLLEHQDVVVGLLNKADHFGATPVHYAAMGPADDILLLLKAKVRIDTMYLITYKSLTV